MSSMEKPTTSLLLEGHTWKQLQSTCFNLQWVHFWTHLREDFPCSRLQSIQWLTNVQCIENNRFGVLLSKCHIYNMFHTWNLGKLCRRRGGVILRARGGGWLPGNSVFQTEQGKHTSEFTAAAAACTWSTQAHSRQHPSMEEGKLSQCSITSWSPIGIWLLLGELSCNLKTLHKMK